MLRSVEDGFFVWSERTGPKSAVVRGRVVHRFIDRIYHHKYFWEWDERQVRQACLIRRRLGQNSLDSELNISIARRMNDALIGLKIDGQSIVLESGCGESLFSAILFKDISALLIGFDSDADALRVQSFHRRTVAADLSMLPFASAAADVCVAMFVFHFRPTWYALPEVVRVLRNEGRLIANFYGPGIDDFIRAANISGLAVRGTEDVKDGHCIMHLEKR